MVLINNKRGDFKRISLIIPRDSKVPTNDCSEISNIFNNLFSSVGPNLASKLPSTNRDFTDYMSGNFDKSFLFNPALIPVYKSQDETDPGNYRPIFLLSYNFNRIFEKVMFKRLKMFLDQNDILFRSQCGFRDKYSTQFAILDIVDTIKSNMDKKLCTCGIFIEIKKAFDTVIHSVLLSFVKRTCANYRGGNDSI